MTPSEKLTDPSWPFLKSMMSLYFTERMTPVSGDEAVQTLPPAEALVLGMMVLNGTYNCRSFRNLLHRKYRVFASEECDMLTEVGILGLLKRGYLKPASKAAEKALAEHDDRVWGLGDVPFVLTAKGAKRIGFLAANFRGEDVKKVVKDIQAESKEDAKQWHGHLQQSPRKRAARQEQAEPAATE